MITTKRSIGKNIQKGIERIGIAIGSIASVFFLCIILCNCELGYLTLIPFFYFTPVVASKIINWIISGFIGDY